jgi:glycine oxidase
MSRPGGGPRVCVVGGGAIGLTVALWTAREGASVDLVDAGEFAANASGVAAGMLAPVFETVFDPLSPDPDLLMRARDLWPSLAQSIGLYPERTGAMAIGSADEIEGWRRIATDAGFDVRRLDASQVATASPWLGGEHAALWSDDDWRLSPAVALRALREAARALGVRWHAGVVADFGGGHARLSDGRRLDCDLLVIATGASRSLARLAPELNALSPIKGHILHAPGLHLSGPVVRLNGGYICPTPEGAMIGATMEPGREDLSVDPMAVDRLRALAGRVAPGILSEALRARTGVRAATADGLPLVGAGRAPGVWIAAGARRNGWLLAPLIARTLAAALSGAPSAPWAEAMRPDRFLGDD